MNIACEEKEEVADGQQERYRLPQEQKDILEVIEANEDNQEKQHLTIMFNFLKIIYVYSF
jgi:hypothetical protein